MDYFNITQICVNCLRGNATFQVYLSLYDANGKLKAGVDEMDRFRFICTFCWKTTALDFYSFSHPSMILHLMHLQQEIKRWKNKDEKRKNEDEKRKNEDERRKKEIEKLKVIVNTL